MGEVTNQVILRYNAIDVIAFIATYIDGEYVEASITRPMSMGLSDAELKAELQEHVWWRKL